MKTKTKNKNTWKTYYDLYKYTNEQIEYFQNDKQEFLISRLWEEDREVESVTDKEVEEHFENDYYIGVDHWEFFREDLEDEFRKHIGKRIYVEGRNMGWRNRSGEKTFILNETIDMFREIAPECDLKYYIEKVSNNEYSAKISHHDSPMGEYYAIKIK